MNKTAIRKFAEWAREKLIEDIKYKVGTVGITANGIVEKLPQSTSDTYFYDVGTKDYTKISGIEIKQRDALVKAIQTKERSYKSYQEAFENVIEEVAYTWFNRLIAIRFMEVNDYLPSGVRVLSSENKGFLLSSAINFTIFYQSCLKRQMIIRNYFLQFRLQTRRELFIILSMILKMLIFVLTMKCTLMMGK